MKKTASSLILLLTSAIWGFAFVSQSQAGDAIGALCYNGLRMLLGFIVLLPLLVKNLKENKADSCSLLSDGLIAGILLFAASFFQQKGIETTSAGKAGFITSLYILFVPIISLFFGKKNSLKTWVFIVSGLFGAFLLSYDGSNGISSGDILVFISAVLFSFHVLFIDKTGKKHNSVSLSAVQFLFAGLIAFILSLIFENNSIESIKSVTIPILYGGIGSCGIAYTLQIVGQKNTEPTKATLILSLESVFSAIGGALILGEVMSIREIIGCAVLFISVLGAQLPDKSPNS